MRGACIEIERVRKRYGEKSENVRKKMKKKEQSSWHLGKTQELESLQLIDE